MKRLKIASLSFIPAKWDKPANILKIERLSRTAAAEGAKVLITPEGALEGYLINDVLKGDRRMEARFKLMAESSEGAGIEKMKHLCTELKVNLLLGFLEKDGEVLYNSSAWINSRGRILHVHRKTHMFQPYYQPEFYHPGNEISAFDTDFGRFGIMICFERQIPEVATALALDGAQVLFNPSYGSRGEWNDILLRTRARDNNVFLVFTHPHQTLIINPEGKILFNRNNRQGIVFAELELNGPDGEKLSKRRPEVFIKKLSKHISFEKKRDRVRT